MTMLLFDHDGWEVVTSSWSAGAKPGKGVLVCYEWGPDGVSWFNNTVATRQVGFGISMADFLALVRKGGVVDLRKFQE